MSKFREFGWNIFEDTPMDPDKSPEEAGLPKPLFKRLLELKDEGDDEVLEKYKKDIVDPYIKPFEKERLKYKPKSKTEITDQPGCFIAIIVGIVLLLLL